MVTVSSYSAELVVDGVAWPASQYVMPFAFLDGTFGLVASRDRYDFTLRDWVNESNILTHMDVIRGLPGEDMALTTGLLIARDLAQLEGGRFVESGSHYSESAGKWLSVVRILTADGTQVGTERILGSSGQNVSSAESIVPLANGGFLLSWNAYDPSNPGNGWDGAFQAFDQRGRAQGGPVALAAPGDQGPPEIALLSDTQIIATWIDTTGLWALRGQVFGLNGAPSGADFTLVTVASNYTSDHRLVAMGDGSFAVMWREEVYDPEGGLQTTTYSLRHFAATGIALGERVDFASGSVGSLSNPQMIVLADGRFAVAWTESLDWPENDYSRQFFCTNYLQIYRADGTKDGTLYHIGAEDGLDSNIRLVALEDGRFASIWERYNPATTASDQISQIFDSRDAAVDLQGNGLGNQYVGSSFGDVMKGLAGRDALFGNEGNDSLYGGADNDLLLGGLGTDRLSGGDGDDYLSGFDGVDRLTGGRGNDLLFGGKSADVFVFAPGDGTDKIKGFADGHDRLDLSDHGFARVGAALRHFAAVDGGVLFVAGTDQVLITGITLADLSGADLILG